MVKYWLAAGAAALSLSVSATAAFAQTTTVPGEQVGLAIGAPLPEGVYGINTFTYRSPDGPDLTSTDTAVNIPVLVWSTPWKVLGARVELAIAPPTVFTFSRAPGGRDTSINVGTFVGGIFAWDLGNNIGVSYLSGVYLNELNAGRGGGLPILASNTYRQGFAISYTGDGWNVTANLTYNFYDTPARFSGRNGIPGFYGSQFPTDALNLDLTATKKFGKFEIGAIGYGTANLPNRSQLAFGAPCNGNFASCGTVVGSGGGRFALGGLVGYDFGKFSVQAWVARDVATSARQISPITGLATDRRAYSTEGWFRVVAPLYTVAAAPEPAPVPLVRKY
ncbi:transporter [Methylobacterium aquaticum]|uniref:CoxB-like protein n=1 Tax=Methylobacterium aquaticum TaxID=270351 RepID=A0A0J6SAM6_9HYPH|nr:transporter [Methylobacterium aquaticum]KMO30782.1 CoxB-like protein [Methylobacterium aquaticum]